MSIFIENETDIVLDFDYNDIIERVISYTEEFVGCPYEAEVNVVLTDNNTIHETNREYRDIDRPTDVLSFPMLEYSAAGDFGCIDEADDSLFHPETGELLLGDIMISIEKVNEQAEEYGHSAMRELAFLVAHSMLHLFGYDHIEDDERQIMEDRQRTILENLGITR